MLVREGVYSVIFQSYLSFFSRLCLGNVAFTSCFFSSSRHRSTRPQSHSLLPSSAAAIPTFLLDVLSFIDYVFFSLSDRGRCWDFFVCLILLYFFVLILFTLTLLKLTWCISFLQTSFYFGSDIILLQSK